MIVRFATLCDIPDCLKRSEEYTSWPNCIECFRDFCPDHGKITREADLDCPERGFCNDCQVVNGAEYHLQILIPERTQ